MDTADTPPTEPQPPVQLDLPSPEPEPVAIEQELAAEREARIRLEGKVDGLSLNRTYSQAPPAQQQPPITPELIEQAFARGEITEPQRIAAHAGLVADHRLSQRQGYDQEASSIRAATADLESLITEHPDLKDSRSDLIAKVKVELGRLAKRDPYFRPQDPRHQLLAVERVLGVTAGGPPVDDREFQRRRAPGGGTGSGGGAPTGPVRRGESPLKGIPQDTVAYWRSHNWIPDAKAEQRYAERYHALAARRRSRAGA